MTEPETFGGGVRRVVALTTSHWLPDPADRFLDITFGDLLRGLAAQVPDRVAFVEGIGPAPSRRRWTYAQLLASAQAVASALLQRFDPGERVAVWAPNIAEWVLLQHGAALAGLVLVTVNPAYKRSELEHVLATAEVAGIFHTDGYRGEDHAALVREARARLPGLRVAVSFADWTSFVQSAAKAPPLPMVRPTDLIQIQFTSGTTGKPKGACLHHRGLLNAARFAAQRAGFPDGGVWGSAMPLFHIGGSAASQFGAFSARGTYVMQPVFDAAAMLELIGSEGIQHLHAVPTMLRAMLEHADLATSDVSTLATVMSGGSSVPPALVRRVREAFGCRFTITFGQTEANGVFCQTHPQDDVDRQATTIGQPAPCVEVKIADPDTGAVRPLGAPGEIWARGYQTMLGYFAQPEASETTLGADGWLKTGDQGTMDAEGYLRITGRLKDCVIRGGENIYPREIEDVLEAHPAVLQASVIGLPDAQWGEVVAAVLRLRASAPQPSALQLFDHCRERLAAYKTPVRWFTVDAYPQTASGKVQKFALREAVARGALHEQPFVKPERQVSAG